MKKSPFSADLIVYGVILAFAGVQFALYRRSIEFMDGETTYVELARSILERNPYGFDWKPETRFPPGFPLILAMICMMTSGSFGALVRSMSVFTALGFITSYELLRREEGRALAAIICLLLISSPEVFYFATQILFPELPYFFMSSLVLFTSTQLELAKGRWSRTVLWLLLSISLVASLMIRTAAIALLAGVLVWLSVSAFSRRETIRPRLNTFLPVLVLGVLVQALWMYWAMNKDVTEWPLKGYPGSYFSEVWLKQGSYPERGLASTGALVSRVDHNLVGWVIGLMKILTHKEYINPIGFSPAVVLPVLLIPLGLASSITQGGGSLMEWYFIAYGIMFLLWPWDYEIRFLLPVAPLACLYLWRGARVLFRQGRARPKAVWAAILPFCLFLSLYSAGSNSTMKGLQPRFSAVFWLALTAISTLMLSKTLWQRLMEKTSLGSLNHGIPCGKGRRLRLTHATALTVALAIIGTGLAEQFRIGQANLRFDLTRSDMYADIEAARYVDHHAASDTVVMARHWDLIYHYCRRKVVWFPPISNPQVLMEGIRRHGVKVIIVVERKASYWLPAESDCFSGLMETYPHAFQLEYHGPRFSVYEFHEPSTSVKHG